MAAEHADEPDTAAVAVPPPAPRVIGKPLARQEHDAMTRLVISAVLLVTVAACGKIPTDSPIVLQGVTLIEPRDGAHVSDGVIVIDSGRIVAASAARDISIPRGATKIDLHGKYAIPGLWDMHTHVQNQRELDVFFPLFVAHGVVGIRDMNGMFPREFSEFGAKHPFRPQVVASGPGIDGPAPAGQEEGAIVDELTAKGVDFIKVFSMIPRSRFLAIMAKAKAHGLVVAGHVPTAVSAMEASDAGMRSLEHHNEMLMNVSSRETELRADRLAKLARLPDFVDRVWEQAFPPIEPVVANSREEKARVLFTKFVANRTWQTPTLADWRVWSLAPFDDAGFWSDSSLSLMPEDWRRSWHGDQNKFLTGKLPSERTALQARAKAWFQSHLDMTRRMHDAGVPFLAGTDVAQWNFMVPGLSLHDELALLVQGGLSPLEALQAATSNAATYLNRSDLGSLKPGSRADIVIVDGDPTADIANSRRISLVVIAGRVLDRRQLDSILAQARESAHHVVSSSN
jgi:imidazolonepropionase-like amidohydrolase